jgi:hypothetical protein
VISPSGRNDSSTSAIETRLIDYVERLDLDTLHAVGADKMPPTPIHAVQAAK